MLMGMITNGDDEVKIQISEDLNCIGGVMGDVNAVFLHDTHGIGIQAMTFNAGAEYISLVSGKMLQVSFCHLAAATVSGA